MNLRLRRMCSEVWQYWQSGVLFGLHGENACYCCLGSVGSPKQERGGRPVAINMTVRLLFANGEEAVTTVQTSPVEVREPEEQSDTPPYRLVESTAPEQPTLVASPDFVSVG